MRDILLKEAIKHLSDPARDLSRMVTNSAFAQHLLEAAYKNGQFSDALVLSLDQVLEVSVGVIENGAVILHTYVSDLLTKFMVFEEAMGQNTAVGFLIMFDPDIVENDSTCQDVVEDITELFSRYNLQKLNMSIVENTSQN